MCASNEVIFPSLEAFELGLEIPTIYFMFYEYFYKSSVGDSRWRRACEEEKVLSSPLGSIQSEAFAMLQLKNNYFAWLLEAKERMQEHLITDYDPDSKRIGKKGAAEVYMKKLELNLDGEEGEEILIAEDNMKYNDLKKNTEEKLKKARRAARTNATYKEVKKALETMRRESNVDAEDESENGMNEREMKNSRLAKRRKLLKPFREYTFPQRAEGKFKGWSKRAVEDMISITKKLKEEKIEHLRFRQASREFYFRRNLAKRKASEMEEVVVDYNEVWDVDDIPLAEI